MYAHFLRLVAVLALAIAPHFARAGIPTIDLAALTQALLEVESLADQLTALKDQYDTMKDQYSTMKDQYAAIKGGRGLGSILNNPALQNYIPKETLDVLRNVSTNGYSGLNGSAKALRDAQMIYNCMNVQDSGQRSRCQAELAQPYQYKAYYNDALQKAGSRTQQIQQLMDRAGTTDDAKEIAEVQARIGAEGALLQHEVSQINLMRGMAEADARIAESQAREAQREALTRKGMLFAKTVTP